MLRATLYNPDRFIASCAFAEKKHSSQRSPSWKVPECTGVGSISPHLVPVAQRCLSSGQLQTSTGTSLTNASGLCLNTFGGKKLLTHQPLVGGSNSQSFHSHPWSCPAFVQFIGSTSALQVRPCPWRGAHVRPRPGSATM